MHKLMIDTSFFKLIKLKKYEDLIDFRSIECIVSIISVIFIDIIFLVLNKYIDIDTFVNEAISFVDNIGMALIGFLGFIVTGLAILTGAISSKVVKRLQNRNKMEKLEKILLSFYLLGIISAFEILCIIILHFICMIPVSSILGINIVIISLLTYLTVFIIFYAVKLIGNCLELFYILNSMQLIDDDATDLKNNYNNYRILALEKLGLSNTSLDTIENYRQIIIELINMDNISDQEKRIYLDFVEKQFDNL